MTLSILALDRASGAIGCAAATGNLAVGAWVLRAAAGVGAVATQGHSVSPLWGDGALERLRAGDGARAALEAVTGGDPGRPWRQLAVLDASGATAAWTGAENPDFRGHRERDAYVLAGNWLASDAVLEAMDAAWRAGGAVADGTIADAGAGVAGATLAVRLLGVLDAAAKAGGDARGLQSAALRVLSRDAPPLDLRVDHDARPLERLRALHARATGEPYASWTRAVPTLDEPYRH